MTACIQAEITWRAEPGDIPGSWVGFCDDLGITIEASSRDELRSLAMESMKSVIGNLLEEGELEDFLRFKGVTYSKGMA